MTQQQEFAALDAGLLARKGEAMPALSNATKTLTDTGLFAPVHPVRSPVSAPTPASTSVPSPAKLHPATMPLGKEAATRDNCEKHAGTPAHDAATPAPPMTARISFRLPMDDYLRLKMAGQLLDKAGRDVMIEALNAYLDRHNVPDLGACSCVKSPSMPGDK
ncbi:MAG: hypothetical protein AAGH42_02985 [Pseudomonadota bacterium]